MIKQPGLNLPGPGVLIICTLYNVCLSMVRNENGKLENEPEEKIESAGRKIRNNIHKL